MSRLAAAPLARLRDLLRGGSAGAVTADAAPTTPQAAISADAPITPGICSAVPDACADRPPAACTEPTTVDDPDPEETEPASGDDTSVVLMAAPLGLDAPVVRGSAGAPAEMPVDGPSADCSNAGIASEPADAEPVTDDGPAATGDVCAEVASPSESAPAEATTDAAPAPGEAPLILRGAVASGHAGETPAAFVEEISAVGAEAAPCCEPPVIAAIPSRPAAPQRPEESAHAEDRPALIRRRWAETGIRMWNPRLHGTGDTTLSIQGRVALLPPATGEKLPRYDKLEFRLLGGQIVCEGVIVEAPVHAAHRNFTRLAEPRARGKPAERQALPA